MLDETEAMLFTIRPRALLRVFTGTGTSWPEAMMAFLLLLVKTVGREMTLNLTRGLKQMHYGREGVASRHVNVSSVAYVLNNLAEVDQVGGIENIGQPVPRGCQVYGEAELDGNRRIVVPENTVLLREVPTNLVVGTLRTNRHRILRCC